MKAFGTGVGVVVLKNWRKVVSRRTEGERLTVKYVSVPGVCCLRTSWFRRQLSNLLSSFNSFKHTHRPAFFSEMWFV
eukprot:scaffold1390_cov172-Amphora_coffeaeformis.AAC.13